MEVILKTIEMSRFTADKFRCFEENMGFEYYKKLSYVLAKVIGDLKSDKIKYKLLMTIKECNSSIEQKNYIAVSDILEYELIPILNQIKG